MDLLSSLLNLLALCSAQVWQRIDLHHLAHVVRVLARRDSDDVILDCPEQQHAGGVDLFAAVLRQALGDLLEDGLEGSTGLVPDQGRQRAVGLSDDLVFVLVRDDRFQVRQDVRVVFDLYSVNALCLRVDARFTTGGIVQTL